MQSYNLEFILYSGNASIEAIKDSLAESGREVEVVELPGHGAGHFKICLFTEDPTFIFDTCAQFGRIKSVKIDEERC